MGWASGFASGVMLGNNVVGQYRAGEQENKRRAIEDELKAIALAKPETIPGQPGASPIQSEINNDPSIAQPSPSPRHQFLGQTFDTPPDEAAQTTGKQLAMAGVYEKYGDVERGMGMRREVRRDSIEAEAVKTAKARDAREATRFDWEKARQDKEDAYTKGRQDTFNNTVFGQRNAAFAKSMDAYTTDKAKYDRAVEAGDKSAVAPVQPAPPSVSMGESLLDYATMAAHDIKHGKADPSTLLKYAEVRKSFEDEGYAQAMKLGQNGAPLTQVVAQFNANGKIKIDPNGIISDKMVTRPGGVKSRIVTFKAPDGSTQTIDTLAELDSMDKADKIFARSFQANADARGAASLGLQAAAGGRAQAEFDAGAPERQVKTTLAGLQKELLDGATPQRAAEINGRIVALQGITGKGAEQPAVVKLATAAMQAGMYTDMASALRWAHENGDKSPQALKADVYKSALTANMGDSKRAQQATEAAMQYLFPAGGAGGPAAAGTGGGAVPAPAQRTVGKVYQTPKGPLKWDGSGWVPASTASGVVQN